MLAVSHQVFALRIYFDHQVIAAYITFGTTMYLLLKEFEWFTDNRHKFLMERVPRNYTIYVSHIPPEFRTSGKLRDYFRSCFSHEVVKEAHIGLKIPDLEGVSGERDAIVNNLEHAINIEEVKGVIPMRGSIVPGGKKTPLIDSLTDELKDINEDIRNRIVDIETMNDPLSFKKDLEAEGGSVVYKGISAEPSVLSEQSDIYYPENENGSVAGSKDADELEHTNHSKNSKAGKLFGNMKNVAGGVAGGLTSIVTKSEDGIARESGFVTFTKLSTTQAALQMVHHHTPFVMEVAEAPNPDDIFWPNIGKNHKQLQMGKLASMALTTLLCLFWTIPVTFVVALTSLEGLKGALPFLEGWIEEAPWLEPALAQVSPLVSEYLKTGRPFLYHHLRAPSQQFLPPRCLSS